MKFRISNNKSYAAEFSAENKADFYRELKAAAASFRENCFRRVHRGEMHRDVFWCEAGYLHIYNPEAKNWFGPGRIDTVSGEPSKSGLAGSSFFVPRETPVLRMCEVDRLESVILQDQFGLLSMDLWEQCMSAIRWCNALYGWIYEVGDVLKQLTDEEE